MVDKLDLIFAAKSELALRQIEKCRHQQRQREKEATKRKKTIASTQVTRDIVQQTNQDSPISHVNNSHSSDLARGGIEFGRRRTAVSTNAQPFTGLDDVDQDDVLAFTLKNLDETMAECSTEKHINKQPLDSYDNTIRLESYEEDIEQYVHLSPSSKQTVNEQKKMQSREEAVVYQRALTSDRSDSNQGDNLDSKVENGTHSQVAASKSAFDSDASDDGDDNHGFLLCLGRNVGHGEQSAPSERLDDEQLVEHLKRRIHDEDTAKGVPLATMLTRARSQDRPAKKPCYILKSMAEQSACVGGANVDPVHVNVSVVVEGPARNNTNLSRRNNSSAIGNETIGFVDFNVIKNPGLTDVILQKVRAVLEKGDAIELEDCASDIRLELVRRNCCRFLEKATYMEQGHIKTRYTLWKDTNRIESYIKCQFEKALIAEIERESGLDLGIEPSSLATDGMPLDLEQPLKDTLREQEPKIGDTDVTQVGQQPLEEKGSVWSRIQMWFSSCPDKPSNSSNTGN